MFEKIKTRYIEWRRKRKWNAEMQIAYLRRIVMEDNRWMANNPIASELTERYLKLLADDWERHGAEDVSNFRERIGLCPHKRSNAKLCGGA